MEALGGQRGGEFMPGVLGITALLAFLGFKDYLGERNKGGWALWLVWTSINFISGLNSWISPLLALSLGRAKGWG